MPKTSTTKKGTPKAAVKKSATKSKRPKKAIPAAAPKILRATFTSTAIAITTADPAPAAANGPAPQLCPKEEVGNVVQDFIDFGGAAAVTATARPDGQWLVQSV